MKWPHPHSARSIYKKRDCPIQPGASLQAKSALDFSLHCPAIAPNITPIDSEILDRGRRSSMKKLLALMSLFVALLSVSLAWAEDAEKAGPDDNKPPEGFTALFSGKDTTNWQGAIDF